MKQGDKKKNEEKVGKDKYCGEGGNARMRRENNINVEEGLKKLRRETNKIVEAETNQN